jgi:hypothetical protein
MAGLSFGLGAKRTVSQRAPTKPKKPLTVNDLFSADSSDEEEEQPPKQKAQQQRQEPQQAQPSKRSRWEAAGGRSLSYLEVSASGMRAG